MCYVGFRRLDIESSTCFLNGTWQSRRAIGRIRLLDEVCGIDSANGVFSATEICTWQGEDANKCKNFSISHLWVTMHHYLHLPTLDKAASV